MSGLLFLLFFRLASDRPFIVPLLALPDHARQLLEADESSDEEEEQVSMMILPDYSSGSGEKDINVLGFCLRFAGQELLSSADLRLAYARRYGKTSLIP